MDERFWSKVEPEPNSGCWLWTGSITRKGYGVFCFRGKNLRAHRFIMGAGSDVECVMHLCDTRCCVNPDHLRCGTHQENSDDMRRKRRQGYTKLRPADVRSIKSRLASGETRAAISRDYGVNPSTITHIAIGHTWKQEW